MPQATEPSVARSAFGDALVRSLKLMSVVRQRAPRVHAKVDPIGYPLMFNLRDEPRRVSEIAERVHLDISTVSRQVSALVTQGLVAKVADPSDGRAQMLTLTDDGRQLLTDIRDRRNTWLAEVVHDWSDADLATFDSLLTRFADDVEAHPLLTPKDLA
ncbi:MULTISPECIES: MarR family winged helix-turn-helix transcriptional regulator [unclassified Knoellia]|uniref:MarR family winged helix-turn-helix transcriptional regulator n=1 Tax=Knoellia altitudinis TaxID=3404795 RepID=UPI00361EB39A